MQLNVAAAVQNGSQRIVSSMSQQNMSGDSQLNAMGMQQNVTSAVSTAMMKAVNMNVNVNMMCTPSANLPTDDHRVAALKFATNGVAMSPRRLLFCEHYLAGTTNRSIDMCTPLLNDNRALNDSNHSLPTCTNTNPFPSLMLAGLCATSSSTDTDLVSAQEQNPNLNRNLMCNLASPSECSQNKIVKGAGGNQAASLRPLRPFSVGAAQPSNAHAASQFDTASSNSSTSNAAYAHTMKDEQSDLHKQRVLCYVTILNEIASYADWRPTLSSILQPIPFPEKALRDRAFTAAIKPTVRAIAHDANCDVHSRLLSIREGKDGWFHLYCPGAFACDDDGELFCTVVRC